MIKHQNFTVFILNVFTLPNLCSLEEVIFGIKDQSCEIKLNAFTSFVYYITWHARKPTLKKEPVHTDISM